MKLDLPSGPSHLTYCSNVHRGETWTETFDALQEFLPSVKRRSRPDGPMGVGLRLSAVAAEQLDTPSALEALQGFLRDEDLYVFTINGFPYGSFHGGRVKERVYLPDWQQHERLDYTDRLATLLAFLLPPEQPDLFGSVSTVPGAFRTLAADAEVTSARVAHMLLRHVAGLATLENRTGRRIVLALEPEPMCLMETTAETIEFFERHLLSRQAVDELVRLSGRTRAASEALLRRHLGVCLDVCHAAVEFETIRHSVAALRCAGIEIAKLQLSSALVVPRMNDAAAALLRRFDDGVYLHQVVQRGPAGLVRFLDLPDALASWESASAAPASAPADGVEWRVHCHVPVFHDAPLDGLATTQPTLLDMLDLQREEGVSPHLEVETYTWDVLPPELAAGPLDAAIARELGWVRGRLGS